MIKKSLYYKEKEKGRYTFSLHTYSTAEGQVCRVQKVIDHSCQPYEKGYERIKRFFDISHDKTGLWQR